MPVEPDVSPADEPGRDALAARGWRRAYLAVHRFLFEKEPGFLPTPHLDDPATSATDSRDARNDPSAP